MKPICLFVLILLTCAINVSAQTCSVLVTNPFKIKLARTVSSATAREFDYVEFTLLEDIYSVPNTGCSAAVLIPKDTSIFAIVTRRKHRHFPFKKGELELQLLPLKIWNGSTIDIKIRRHIPSSGTNPAQPCKGVSTNCIGGRKNTPVAPLVEATAAGGSAVVAGVAESSATRIIAAAGLFELLAQGGVTEILNGTDAQLEEGEVFDLELKLDAKIPPPPRDKD